MYQKISMTDLHNKMTKLGPKDLVLDVRTEEEFAEGHVPGSKNIPHEDVERRASELKGFEHIYVHCRSGKRSQIASDILMQLGFKNLICISVGGMMDWEEAGYPIQK